MQHLLRNKVVVVTGAAGGIGAESAKYFAEQGAIVVLTDLERSDVKQDAQQLEQQGHEAICISADLCVEDQVASLFEQVHSQFGRIGGLMCRAGVGYQQKVLETDAEAFGRVLEIRPTVERRTRAVQENHSHGTAFRDQSRNC